MWRLVQIRALTGAGVTCFCFEWLQRVHDMLVYNVVFILACTWKTVKLNTEVLPIWFCSWRDTVIGDHSKIDNLVQVGVALDACQLSYLLILRGKSNNKLRVIFTSLAFFADWS